MTISQRAVATAPPPQRPARLITDDELERALDWLRDHASSIGEAKRRSVMASHMIKHVKALVMKEFNHLPVSKAEVEAYASDRYLKALEEDAAAAGEYETMKALREAAALKIEAWRTEAANFRAMKI